MHIKSNKIFKYNCACLALFIPIFAQNTFAQTSQTSVWTSSEGRLTLHYDGRNFNGNYDNDGGRVSGTRKENILEGYWGEDSSGTRCSTERLNTYYWGKIRWEFNGNSFSGKYSYCDNDWSGSWNGTLESGSAFVNVPQPPPKPPIAKPIAPPPINVLTSAWNSSEGTLNLVIKGQNVSGTYVNDNGRISGTKKGNTITGFWGEDSSATKCTTKKLNTYYWGKIKWVFNGNSFSGQYSYCEGTMSGSWSGTKR